MFRLIIERPRLGGGRAKGHRREARARRDPDSAPLRESMRRHGKSLNENLAPLRRFLERRVGRPWDDVYSEIRARIAPSSAVQMHIVEHLWQFVARHVVLIDGKPYDRVSRGAKREPFALLSYFRPSFYVCPETGVLKVCPRFVRPKRPRTGSA